MTSCVVDASVLAAAFFRERHSAAARALLRAGRELHAPDLVWGELGNVIWKRHARGEISAHEAADLLADFLALPLRITPSAELVALALELALRTARTVHDCLYLALAVKTGTVMVSGDKRLVNALATGPLAKHVAWIGERR